MMNTWEIGSLIGSGGKNSWSDSTREISALTWSKVRASNLCTRSGTKVGNLISIRLLNAFAFKSKYPHLFIFGVEYCLFYQWL